MAQANSAKDSVFLEALLAGRYTEVSGNIYNSRGKKLGTTNSRGYITIGLMHEGKLLVMQAHRLIWMAHHGLIADPDAVINHKDGDKQNNHINNLELVSRDANAQHAYETGLNVPNHMIGERNHAAKLTEEKVRLARQLYRAGTNYSELSRTFGVSVPTIQAAVCNKTWKHVE